MPDTFRPHTNQPVPQPAVVASPVHSMDPPGAATAPAALPQTHGAAGATLNDRLDAAGQAWRERFRSNGYVVVFNVLNPRWSSLALRENVRDPVEMDQKALLAMNVAARRALNERLCK